MSFQQKRVVVTGLGAVSPVGNDVESCWKSLLAGKSGIGPVSKFDTTGYRCTIAGEVKGLDIDAFIDPKEAKRLDLFCHYAVVASDEALAQAGLTKAQGVDPTRIGVIVSSGIGGLTTIEDQIRTLAEKGPRAVSPLSIPMMISNMASGYVAIRHNLKGPNFSIVTACASGLHSIGEAYWMIVRGDADVMVCGGTEAVVEPFSLAGFGSLKALTANNDDPEHASRPFDKLRDGFVPAEGSGVLVIESEEHAKKRGANILAEIAGYGLSADAFHITHPAENGEGVQRADPSERHDGNHRPEDGSRRKGQADSRQQHEIHDRPHARRGGRLRIGRLRQNHSGRRRSAHDELRDARSGMRPRLRPQRSTRSGRAPRAQQQSWIWRAQRLRPVR